MGFGPTEKEEHWNNRQMNHSEIHWSENFSKMDRISFVACEIVEWNFLLLALIGMYKGVEIGHPGLNWNKSGNLFCKQIHERGGAA